MVLRESLDLFQFHNIGCESPGPGSLLGMVEWVEGVKEKRREAMGTYISTYEKEREQRVQINTC